MSSTSLRRRGLTPQRAKEVFKVAMKKRPESIEHLKQSVAISVGKYQRFMKYLKDSTELFHTSYFRDEVGIASKRKANQKIKRGKDFRIQLDADALPTQKPHRDAPLFALPTPTTAKVRVLSRLEAKTQKTQQCDVLRREQTPTSMTTNFWKKVGKGSQKAHRRWKTDADERVGENTIGDITRFDHQNHAKAVNYLVIQLQLNIQDSKRCRIKTGIQE